jgi:hypothetical protein
MTAFRRRVRYHQARWREAKGGIPSGPSRSCRDPGSRCGRPGVGFRSTTRGRPGRNFLTASALAAVRARTAVTEAHQSFEHQRLWADLLWSPALGFNLAGDLAADLELADRAIHRWWPEAPGRLVGPSWPSCGWSTCCCCRCSSTPAAAGAGAASSSSTRLASATTPSSAPATGRCSRPVDLLVGDRRGGPGRRCPPRGQRSLLSATGTCPCDRGPCIDGCQSSARVTSIADAKEPPVTASSPARAGA